jgi:hypothetical protein
MLLGRLHIAASASTSGGSASDNGWLTSILGTDLNRKIVFDVLMMCCWRI